MKTVLCDVCGQKIDKRGLKERYSFWMKDSVYYKRLPLRLDICSDCKEAMSEMIIRKRRSREANNG